MKLIQSRENPFFKELVKLADSSRHRNLARQTLLDGVHLLTAFLDSGRLPQHILLNLAALQDEEIAALLKRVGDIPITQLGDKLFSELSELKSPSGILALIALPVQDAPHTDSRFALMLEEIQDPGNLGSMLRSAAAAGCDSVFMSYGCADAWSPKVLRAAMGGHFVLRIYEQQNLQALAKVFPGTLLAASLRARSSLYDCDLRGNVAFLIGNEGAGLSGDLLNLAKHVISIPMPGKAESLNAAAAAAICLFEAVRQRITSIPRLAIGAEQQPDELADP